MSRRPAHDLSGTLLDGRYRLVRRLGIGSVGSVYQGHTEVRDDDESRPIKIRQVVAIKVLHENLTHDPLDVSRFKREARAASELRHAHVVDVIDFVARAGEPPAIIMEYLVGQSLHDLLKTDHRIPPSRALRIGVQVLAALGHAHRKKILHRDIKPENLFLIPAAGGGVFVKVLDFGSAKLLGEATGIPITATGMVTGTLALMPPEQARSMRIDRRVDLYGLAATLYMAVAGQKPFGAMAPADILAAVLNDEPPSLVPLGIDADLDALLRRGLRKNPDERFQTAHEMEQALRSWLAKHGEPDRWEWTAPPAPDLRDITPPRATTTIPPPSRLRDDSPKTGGGQATLDGVSVDAAVPSSRLPTSGRRIASAVDLAAMPAAGGIFGRYRIHALLGTGGVSEVFRAEDTEIPRTVALKVLHVARGGNETGLTTDAATRILREARLVAEMRHPNAVEVYDVDERGGLPYLVMELIEGQTFRDLVRDPFVFVEEKIAWLTDVAHALSYGHKRGIVHRDIKPENIMLRGSDRAVKVLDFGIAQRMFERGAEASEVTERIPGTPAYMAPEQMRGKDATPLTDQWAWGVVAYELLAGTHPWMQRGGMLHLVDQIMTRIPDLPSRRRGDVPPEVEAVVLRALAKDPDERYGSMDEVIDALRTAWTAAKASGRPFVRPADAKATATRASWRRRGLVATAVAAVIAVCGIVAPRVTERHEQALLASSSEAERADEGSAMSANAEAVAAYRAGVEAIRNAAGGAARKNLERATTLDPSFALAHLRRVLATPWVGDAERESVRVASRLRGTLGEHDRALLQAIEPWVGEPQDAGEVDRRLSALAAAHPDADTLYQLCRFRFFAGSYAKAIDACRAAEVIDPKFAGAVWLEGQSRLFSGDTAGGSRDLDRCLALSPASTSCLNDVFVLKSYAGACSTALGYAERLVALEPENGMWLELLGTVSYAAGKQLADVRGAYERANDRRPVGQIPASRARVRANLAILSGDFDEATNQLEAWDHSIADNSDEQAHADLFHVRALVQRELGDDAASLMRARAFIASQAAWSPSVEGDSSIDAQIALYRAGSISRPAFVTAREEWLAHERTLSLLPGRAGIGPGNYWLTAYADAAMTTLDAQEALTALPNFQPLPPERLRFTYDDEAIGRVFLLAGRSGEAIPFLRRAASSCDAAEYPLQHTWANFELGHALESTDVAGACAAYKVVIDRWAASPRSHSALRARERWTALACR